MINRGSARLAPFLAVALFAIPAAAFAADEPIPLWGIEPKEDPSLEAGGKIVALEGKTDTVAHRFVVQGLKITEPVSVMVTATNPGDDLQVQLAKYSFDHPDRSGSTKTDRSQLFRLRTEGDLKISISGPQAGMPYQLLVWKGDQIQPPLDPVLLPPAEYARLAPVSTKGAAAPLSPAVAVTSSTSPVLWVIAGLLFVVVALLAVMVLRRRQA